jgi:uncharacterized membrane protein
MGRIDRAAAGPLRPTFLTEYGMKRTLRKSGRLLTKLFLQGLAAMLPIVLTGWILYWLATTAEAFLGGFVKWLFPELPYWTGLGVLLGVALVFGVGLLMNAWITRRLVAAAESLLERIPLVKTIYGSIRDLAHMLTPKGPGERFQKVVSVAVADRVRVIGFVTREDFAGLPDALGDRDELIGVYLPMSYQIGGYTAYMPRAAVEPLAMSVEDAMRFTLTAGMSGPVRKSDKVIVPGGRPDAD